MSLEKKKKNLLWGLHWHQFLVWERKKGKLSEVYLLRSLAVAFFPFPLL